MEDLGTVSDVKIITAAISYDDPEAWHTCILFYHHALHIPTMQRHLLNPNQMRANDVIVNETPLVLLPYDLRNKHSHSIVATTELHEELHVPLKLEGATSFFLTRMPTSLGGISLGRGRGIPRNSSLPTGTQEFLGKERGQMPEKIL